MGNSYKALIEDATKLLYEASDTPRIDAEVIMQHIIEHPLAWLIAYGDTLATTDHVQQFYQLVEERQQGQPIAYLVGKRDFWSLSLKVSTQVLIPRPDTETLVEHALQRLPNDAPVNVLDLGTGSGAIALSLAKERPLSRVTAVDSQTGALAVARENARINNITNVDFIKSDWFHDISSDSAFELIASNPPYIEAGDPHLTQGDLRFEPSSALVAKHGGLSDLTTIIHQSLGYLSPNGWLIVEHGYNQAESVTALFKQAGYQNIECYNDLNELPRCTVGQNAA